MPTNTDTQIDGLYRVPLEEFVARRNELARSLRKDGNRREADEVKALRKPTVPAWTVNQLARREKMRLRGLLTAGERLRTAHGDLLAGGSADALQQTRDDERRAIAELIGAAASLLDEAGHPANEPTLERVRETLHAAASDEEIGRRVREGRLDRETQVTGFGFENPPSAPAANRATRAKAKTAAKPVRKRKPKHEEAAREKRAQERKAKQEEARASRRRAEERVNDARRALKEAERAVKNQARELERAEGRLKSKRAEVENAEREVERARRLLEAL